MRKPRTIKNPAIDQSAPACIVMAEFGGLSAFCKACGFNPSTAYRWLVNGLIPANRQAHVLAVAENLAIQITPEMFVPAPRAKAA